MQFDVKPPPPPPAGASSSANRIRKPTNSVNKRPSRHAVTSNPRNELIHNFPRLKLLLAFGLLMLENNLAQNRTEEQMYERSRMTHSVRKKLDEWVYQEGWKVLKEISQFFCTQVNNNSFSTSAIS